MLHWLVDSASFDFYSRVFHILVDFTTYDTVHGEAVKNKKKKWSILSNLVKTAWFYCKRLQNDGALNFVQFLWTILYMRVFDSESVHVCNNYWCLDSEQPPVNWYMLPEQWYFSSDNNLYSYFIILLPLALSLVLHIILLLSYLFKKIVFTIFSSFK